MKEFICIILSIVMFINIICFFVGAMNANSTIFGHCKEPWSKLDYAFPAYYAGCYLNKREV